MKKQDVLNALESKFASVLDIKEVERVGSVVWYLANVFDAGGDNATKRNIGFYVVDEDKVTEAAYWHGNEPKPSAPALGFQQLLQGYIGGLVAASAIEGGQIVAVDASNETAVVTVWLVSGTAVEAKTFFVDIDPEGKWQRREIVSA